MFLKDIENDWMNECGKWEWLTKNNFQQTIVLKCTKWKN